MFRTSSKIGLLSLFLTLWVIPVYAANNKTPVSLEQASESIRKQSKGKVLSAKTTNFNGQRQHRIQVLTPSGRVKIFQVPAKLDDNRNRNISTQNQNRRQSVYSNNQNRSNFSNSRNTNNYTAPENSNKTSKGNNKQK